MTGYAFALWCSGTLGALAVAGLVGMMLHDWLEERRRKRRLYRVTVPPPR